MSPWTAVFGHRMPLEDIIGYCTAWAVHTFGQSIADNRKERALRVLEEATEFAVALGVTRESAIRVVESVTAKPPGNIQEEAADVLITLAVACSATETDLGLAVALKMANNERPERVEQIRRKQATKAAAGIGVEVVQ